MKNIFDKTIYSLSHYFFFSLLLSILCANGIKADIHEKKRFQELNYHAVKLLEEGKGIEAISTLEQMVILQPANESVKFQLARVLLLQDEPDTKIRNKNYNRALQLLEECIKIHESISEKGREMAERYFYAGMGYWFTEQYENAQGAFLKSLRADSTMKEAAYNRMAVLEEMNRNLEAEKMQKVYDALNR